MTNKEDKTKISVKAKVRVLRCRVTQKEYNQILRQYENSGYGSLSAWLRYLLFSKKVSIQLFQEDGELLRQLSRKNTHLNDLKRQIAYIGNNINQIARKVNTYNYTGSGELTSIIILLTEINDMVKKLCDD